MTKNNPLLGHENMTQLEVTLDDVAVLFQCGIRSTMNNLNKVSETVNQIIGIVREI